MSQTDEKGEQTGNVERLKEQTSACGPGCNCSAEQSSRTRWVVGAIIVVVAGVLLARALLKSDNPSARETGSEFALPQPSTAQQATTDSTEGAPSTEPKTTEPSTLPETATQKADDKPIVCGELIRSLGDLNSKAMDKDAVFVFLAGQDAAKNREIAAVIEKGAATLRVRNINMGVFTLKDGSSEYANIARQVPPPGVIAMVKGRGASAVSDDVTESKLMQAFVAASSAGGCGPSGCGPSSSGCR